MRLIQFLPIAVLCCIGSGCKSLDRYERTYSLTGSMEDQTVAASITLRPVTNVSTPVTLNEKTIKELIKIALEDFKASQMVPSEVPFSK